MIKTMTMPCYKSGKSIMMGVCYKNGDIIIISLIIIMKIRFVCF